MKSLKLKSDFDDVELSVLALEPDVEPLGTFQIVHGMCEHKGRYMEFAEYLRRRGFVVVLHDHRGHGESVKSPEDLGYMYSGGWRALVEDVKKVGDWARNTYRTPKFILFGHSMGSLVVRSYLKRYDSDIDALFVSGSPSYNAATPVGKFLAYLFGTFGGWRCRPELLHSLSFGTYNKAFPGETDPSAWVCSVLSVQRQHSEDPLCHYVFTANGYFNLLSLMQDCYSSKGWEVANPSLLIRFLSGRLDPCRIGDRKHESSLQILRRAGYTDVDGVIFEGMRHEVLNEAEKYKVWHYIIERI